MIVRVTSANENIDGALNARERVLHFVRQARRQLADERKLRRAMQLCRLLLNLLFGLFKPGDVVRNSHVLIRLAMLVEERNDRRVDPVNTSVLGAIAELAPPNLSAR